MREHRLHFSGKDFDSPLFREKRFTWIDDGGPDPVSNESIPSEKKADSKKEKLKGKALMDRVNQIADVLAGTFEGKSGEAEKKAFSELVQLFLEKDAEINLKEAKEFARNVKDKLLLAGLGNTEIPQELFEGGQMILLATRAGFITQDAVITARTAAHKEKTSSRKTSSSSAASRSERPAPLPGRNAGQQAQAESDQQWYAHASKNRAQERQFKESVRAEYSDIKENKEERLKDLQREMTELAKKMVPLDQELQKELQNKNILRAQLKRRYSNPRSKQVDQDGFNLSEAMVKVIGDELKPLRERYKALDEIHKRFNDGLRFAEWRLEGDNDVEFKEWVEEKTEKGQAEGDAMDSEDRAKAEREAKAKAIVMEWNSNRNSPKFADEARRAKVDGILQRPSSNTSNNPQWDAKMRSGQAEDDINYMSPTGNYVVMGEKNLKRTRHNDATGQYDVVGGPGKGGKSASEEQEIYEEMRESYALDDEEFVIQEFDKHKNDPAYDGLKRAYRRAQSRWTRSPHSRAGDLAIMRDQIQFMQKRGEMNADMNTERTKLKEKQIKSLKSVSLGSPGGQYFGPGEYILITVPSHEPDKPITIPYNPSEVLGVSTGQADARWEALMDAGIIIDEKNTRYGVYDRNAKRPRVKEVKIDFTKPGEYKIERRLPNDEIYDERTIHIGEDGKVTENYIKIDRRQKGGPGLSQGKEKGSSIPDVTEANFDKEVLKSDIPVLVGFWAPWCHNCEKMFPMMEQVQKEFPGKLKVVKLNIDKNPNIANKYKIAGVPTFLIFDKGEVVDTSEGQLPKGPLKRKNEDEPKKPDSGPPPKSGPLPGDKVA